MNESIKTGHDYNAAIAKHAESAEVVIDLLIRREQRLTYDGLTDLAIEGGVDYGRREAIKWATSCGGKRVLSRSTSVPSNLLDDARRSAAIAWLDQHADYERDEYEYIPARAYARRHYGAY